jgi:acetyl-CoA carboxylase biotin carboxyl carrier protein
VRKLDIDVNEIKKLLDLVEKYHLEELTVQYADVSVTVKGKASKPASPAVKPAGRSSKSEAASEPVEHEAQQTIAVEQSAVQAGNIVDIVAPLVGVFYRSAAPDAPPCVEVGDVIEIGTEVGLIEAMKVFSSIPSEVAGEVVEIPGQNGRLVHEGDVLVRVRAAQE